MRKCFHASRLGVSKNARTEGKKESLSMLPTCHPAQTPAACRATCQHGPAREHLGTDGVRMREGGGLEIRGAAGVFMDSGFPMEKHASRPHPGRESASFAASRIDGPTPAPHFCVSNNTRNIQKGAFCQINHARRVSPSVPFIEGIGSFVAGESSIILHHCGNME